MSDGGRPGRLAGWQTGTGFDLSMHGLTNNWLEVPLTLSRGLLREELSLGRERERRRERIKRSRPPAKGRTSGSWKMMSSSGIADANGRGVCFWVASRSTGTGRYYRGRPKEIRTSLR